MPWCCLKHTKEYQRSVAWKEELYETVLFALATHFLIKFSLIMPLSWCKYNVYHVTFYVNGITPIYFITVLLSHLEGENPRFCIPTSARDRLLTLGGGGGNSSSHTLCCKPFAVIFSFDINLLYSTFEMNNNSTLKIWVFFCYFN